MSAVCSIMIYGSEAWRLDDEVKRALNGANSKMVSAITDRTIREEATPDKTYDVIAGIRATRLRWVGSILRLLKRNGEERIIKKAVRAMYNNRMEGDILMDVPATDSWEALCKLAEDRKEWKGQVRAIKDTIYIVVTKGKKNKNKVKRKRRGKNKKSKKKLRQISARESAVGGGSGEDVSEEDEEEKEDDWGMSVVKEWKLLGGRGTCKDGFAMSVQAFRAHVCVPRDDTGPYSAVEVGYPSAVEPLLMPYRDAASVADVCVAPPIYVAVPARVIHEVIEAHAGLRHDSAALPPLVELDNGEAEPPSTSVTGTSTEEEA